MDDQLDAERMAGEGGVLREKPLPTDHKARMDNQLDHERMAGEGGVLRLRETATPVEPVPAIEPPVVPPVPPAPEDSVGDTAMERVQVAGELTKLTTEGVASLSKYCLGGKPRTGQEVQKGVSVCQHARVHTHILPRARTSHP